MPDPESMGLEEKAVLWPLTGYDRNNEPKRGAPVEIDVRWVWKDGYITDAQGNTIGTSAQVMVDQDIEVGSFMWYGQLSDYTATAEQKRKTLQVVGVDKTPSIDFRSYMRVVNLSYFRSTPTV